jgi:hypothetical protein
MRERERERERQTDRLKMNASPHLTPLVLHTTLQIAQYTACSDASVFMHVATPNMQYALVRE